MPDPTPSQAVSGVELKFRKEISFPTAVLALEGSPQGGGGYAACLDGGVYQVDWTTGKRQKLAQHASYASGVHLLRRQNVLVSAGYDGQLHWIDLESAQVIRSAQAHAFWSWHMHGSPDERWIATATGQYLAGGYKYEPAPEQEPSVRVLDAATGALRWSFSHVPPVLSVAFSPDSRHLAAANMMGEVRVWDLETGAAVSQWTTPIFTSWGIIKSHHYIGGIFDLAFTPGGEELLACGMGPMGDPMAGNGKQTWQRFAWREGREIRRIRDGDAGNGLMETLGFHPSGGCFLMAGRLMQGKWNAALFEADGGKLLHSQDVKMRVTGSWFSPDGGLLALSGAVGQEKKRNGRCPDFGRLKLYDVKLLA